MSSCHLISSSSSSLVLFFILVLSFVIPTLYRVDQYVLFIFSFYMYIVQSEALKLKFDAFAKESDSL